jgi:hypothetical protein
MQNAAKYLTEHTQYGVLFATGIVSVGSIN